MTKFDYFGDCPICQAMKAAEQRGRNSSETGLKEAFARAKAEGRGKSLQG